MFTLEKVAVFDTAVSFLEQDFAGLVWMGGGGGGAEVHTPPKHFFLPLHLASPLKSRQKATAKTIETETYNYCFQKQRAIFFPIPVQIFSRRKPVSGLWSTFDLNIVCLQNWHNWLTTYSKNLQIVEPIASNFEILKDDSHLLGSFSE